MWSLWEHMILPQRHLESQLMREAFSSDHRSCLSSCGCDCHASMHLIPPTINHRGSDCVFWFWTAFQNHWLANCTIQFINSSHIYFLESDLQPSNLRFELHKEVKASLVCLQSSPITRNLHKLQRKKLSKINVQNRVRIIHWTGSGV